MGDPPAFVDTVARRREFLDLLTEPRTKPELVDATDVARSTVDRAIESLREEGLVSRDGSAYQATYAGRHVGEAYDQFVSRTRTLQTAQPVLEPLPADTTIPPAALDGATVLEATPEAPQAPVDHNTELVAGATEFRGTGPAVIPQYTETVAGLVETGTTVELVLTEAVVDALRREYAEGFERLRTADDLGLYVTDESVPYAVWTARTPDGPVSGLVVYTESGIKGVVTNGTAAMNEWARAEYESYRATAEPLD
ncbi:helix-turn-helix transcriptional regulator [Halomicroarcula sp. GCM10025709]|uniref:helix-turn-helix transcriptional regulator n=1 Tax=Haloarcula TaxID=2237 RepID=UPI0024C44280|nr:helix-turn-helix domain-containing protein [Halomicroarcula sp. YJ-61-S]